MTELFEWHKKSTLELIEIYRNYALLWDPNIPEYKNKELRQNALTEIAKQMNIDKSEIERKIKNVSSHYLRELKKEKESEFKGCVAYKSKWFAFKAMGFLNERRHKRKTSNPSSSEFSTVEDEEEASQNSEESTIDQTSPTYEFLPQRRRIKIEDPLLESIAESRAFESNSASCNESSKFGEYIASKIKPMDKRTRAIVEYEVNSIIFRAEMGYYSDKKFDDIGKFND